MKFIHLIFFLFIFSSSAFTQKKLVTALPNYLNEISGLVFLNDSVLVAHNDGGHEPKLYFLNLTGKVFHSIKVENALNVDWEDITIDPNGYLYIADIGNNNNLRKDLAIYKLNTRGILESKSILAEKISFTYPDQKSFPPAEKDLHFDAEGIAYFKDSLYIFTKCRAVPFDGKAYCYSLPTKVGNYVATKGIEYFIGKKGWWKDSVTATEIKNGKCYLLTYDRILIYTFTSRKLEFLKEIKLGVFSQREAIAVNSKGQIFIADEEQKIVGGGNLYRIKIPKNGN